MLEQLTAPARERGGGRPPPARLWPAYLAALAVWLGTRLLVLIHQGSWPWMNAFVVEAARGIAAGEWNEAVRPPLPALLALPLVLLGATERQAVAALYLLASLLQFACYLLLARRVFPNRRREQLLALLLFLLVPLNHSIHHYRDVPVLLASSGVFLLSAHWLWALGRPAGASVWRPRSVIWALGATLLGVWSRTEMLAFVAALLVFGAALLRGRVWRVVPLYLAASLVGIATLAGVSRAAGVDPGAAARYQVHTFLDSTPTSWLSPACRASPTESCRDRDGEAYFGPVDRGAGVLGIALAHPLLTLAKSARSGLDNAWMLFGANISTYPAIAWLAALALLAYPPSRAALRSLPGAVWAAAGAALAVSVLPPLSWAPPHPQYHLQTLLPVMVLVAPIGASLLRLPRGSLLLLAFFAGSAALSGFRYTRYPGY